MFDCPTAKVKDLTISLFRVVKEIVPNSLPNYTIRGWNREHVKISLRVLRDRNQTDLLERLNSSITEVIEGVTEKIDRFDPSWKQGAPLKKCRAYNRLSEFVVRLAEEDLFEVNDRNEMRHLAINMLFMREAVRRWELYALFVDLISRKVLRQPYPIQVPASGWISS